MVEIGRDPWGASGLDEFGQTWVNASVFQFFLISFVYSHFVLSSSFFPIILKLTQIWE